MHNPPTVMSTPTNSQKFNPDKFRKHMIQTYANMRYGLVVIGFALPLILWFGGLIIIKSNPDEHLSLLKDIPQNSISAYYHTPMRNVLVGSLIAIGSFLYLYKGFSDGENYALNIGGIAAIGVALFPTDFPEGICSFEYLITRKYECVKYEAFTNRPVHLASAITLFLSMAYVCIWRAKDTLNSDLIKDPTIRAKYNKIYTTLGCLMILVPLSAFILTYTFPTTVFWVEVAGIWVFSTYWLVKSIEFKKHLYKMEMSLFGMQINQSPPSKH